MPFVVLTLGMAYGWRLGAATVMLYLVEGAAGLPVFAGTPEKGIGLAYMLGGAGGGDFAPRLENASATLIARTRDLD